MRTTFSPIQLADPALREANDIVRKCVHCGFCLATCPTYLLLGDERDSPRGRIYLSKEMLENDAPATAGVVKHIDRCLSCLSCTTTCPSSVDYAHLIGRARAHIEMTYARPLPDRMLRWMLGLMLPRPWLFRAGLVAGQVFRPLRALMPGRLKGMVSMAAGRIAMPSRFDRPQVFPAEGERRMRIALMSGCAQQVLSPGINEATIRLLRRHGCEVVIAKGAGCCGALVHQLGRQKDAIAAARANVCAWSRLRDGGPLDAVIFNASGCGVALKDYGYLLRDDAAWGERAAEIAAQARDVTEILLELGLKPATIAAGMRVTYHSACSMQHGLGLRSEAKHLLAEAGFIVAEPGEGHVCCGSAGLYSILQPELAARLRERKLANIAATEPEIIATGNIGCITQIAAGTAVPVVHTVELLDWATGGPKPAALA